MTSRMWLRLAEILVSVLIAITILVAWHADRRDRAQLATQLAAAQKTIADATANQKNRDTALNQTLTKIAHQKQAAISPAQIVKALPSAISLPAPITLQLQPTQALQSPVGSPPANSPKAAQAGGSINSDAAPKKAQGLQSRAQAAASQSQPTHPAAQQAPAILPAADLKPLYDFALDCKACQAKLVAAQSDLNDEKTKTATLAKERDDAVRAAKGGSTLRRIVRAAKWFVLGAAAGAIAAKAAH